jgi:hypothetical protein
LATLGAAVALVLSKVEKKSTEVIGLRERRERFDGFYLQIILGLSAKFTAKGVLW